MTAGEIYSALVSERKVSVMTGLPYATHDRCQLDIYGPAIATPKGPIVLFIYGGGWVSGDRASYRFVGSAFATNGITTVIPDYRLYPELAFPGFVEDVATAYRWTADRFAKSGRPIIVAGHSAGAHIAALLALDPSYLKGLHPAGLIGLAGPYAFDPTTWPSTKDIFAKAAAMPDQARPIAFASPNAPPALLMHGSADGTVKPSNSIQLAERLSALSRPASLKIFDGIGHMGLILSLSRPFRWRAPTLRSIVNFVGNL